MAAAEHLANNLFKISTVGAAVLAAYLEAYLGKRMLTAVTLRFVKLTVAMAMVAIGSALMTGVSGLGIASNRAKKRPARKGIRTGHRIQRRNAVR
ncbi:MAG: hypothetical protein RL375_3810, partial [Pseudomonadota bacterium]